MLVLIIGADQPAIAQTIQPTADQMRMINQLPPAQRQQALAALRQVQSQGSTGTTQSSITEPLSTSESQNPQVDWTASATPPDLRAEPGSRVVIDLVPKESLTPRQLTELEQDPVLGKLQGSNFYQLDASGVLKLPGLADIPLKGLNDRAIEQRLGAEPSLSPFDISAVLLETQPIGAEALKPFGHDIFEPDTIGFDPVAAGPVPPDYVLGPGDSIRVQLFGNVNGIYEFEVSRDGVLNLPEIGPVTVAGLPFS
ncbi:MAG: polysaccharide biosynthesis/export family protein [Woeseiaceae bacterium]